MKKIDVLGTMPAVDFDPIRAVQEQLKLIEHNERDAIERIGLSAPDYANQDIINAKGKVYRESDIRKLCFKYDFKFLPPSEYIGKVPPSLGKALMDYGVNSKPRGNFKILAPREMFRREIVSWEDPVLFYYLGNGYWEVVHRWGNDMNPIRVLKSAWRLLTHWNCRKFSMDAYIFIYVTLFLAGGLLSFFLSWIPAIHQFHNFLSWSVFGFVVSTILMTVFEWLDRKKFWNKTDQEIEIFLK